MKLGMLKVVENKEGSGRHNASYVHLMVASRGGIETLMMTDRELDTIRQRSVKNIENISSPGVMDKIYAWFLSMAS